MRMVSQARGNESVRRVMQESTVTIEEVEDEVVDLIGMFNDSARGSSARMVKEVKKRPKMNPGTSDVLEHSYNAEDTKTRTSREELTCYEPRGTK